MASKHHRPLSAFRFPQPLNIQPREMWRAAIGATLAVCITASLSYLLNGFAITHHWLVASLGASAVLVFLLPTSPLAQPWPVVGGNAVGAFIGVGCAMMIPHPVAALTVAVATVIPLTYLLRCVHPPSVAVALFAALHGIDDYHFALFPVLFDACVLVGLGTLYNTLTGRPYPVRRAPSPEAGPPAPARFTEADLDTALSRFNQALNIGKEDLEALLVHLETAAFQRTLGTRSSASIMSRSIVSVPPDATLQEAWTLMRQNDIKALPVTDGNRQVLGIITVADFMRHARLDAPGTLRAGLMAFIRWPRAGGKSGPARVRDIMSSPAVTARADQPVAALIPLFSQGRHRHMPVVDGAGGLVGMVTQSDLLVDLYSVLATGKPAGR